MSGGNRSARGRIAAETLAVLEAGEYMSPSGACVRIAERLEACVRGTRMYRREELQSLLDSLPAGSVADATARIEVVDETTLQGLARLAADGERDVIALNFASARNPGGGFLGGSQAQEESLARSSGLYPSLLAAPAYYEHHRQMTSSLYTDAMIFSPACPVFRDDDGRFREKVQDVGFITSAAPNAGAVAVNQPQDVAAIPAVLHERARFVLALAAAQRARCLVLGAWGCGVFRNDPDLVARTFASLLHDEGWVRRFERVLFSVLDTAADKATLRAFRQRLSPTLQPDRG